MVRTMTAIGAKTNSVIPIRVHNLEDLEIMIIANTGWAQVNGRNAISWQQNLNLRMNTPKC